MDAPLIITGMHRSGTTMLVRLLRGQGVFFGAHLDPNLEDFFFLRRNEWLLRRAGGSWESPTLLEELLAQPKALAQASALFENHVRSRAFRRFVGGGGQLPERWGWKDPRNIFTMPVWERVFPDARLIYIRRNGVDVAASLRTRDRKRRASNVTTEQTLHCQGLVDRLRNAWQSVEFHQHYLYPARTMTLEVGFALWEQYVARAERMLAEHSGPQLVLSFEELSQDTERVLATLADFVGLDISSLAEWAESVHTDRAHAYRGDPELRVFHESKRDSRWMRELGYAELT